MSTRKHNSASSRSSSRSTASARAVNNIGSVPKRAPKYMTAFFGYVAAAYVDDAKKEAKINECNRLVSSMFTKFWPDFQEYVSSMRPAKKQRLQPYTESKLSKDTKVIVTKLQTMDEHLPSLNPEDVLEHVENIYLSTKQIYRKVRDSERTEVSDRTGDPARAERSEPDRAERSEGMGDDSKGESEAVGEAVGDAVGPMEIVASSSVSGISLPPLPIMPTASLVNSTSESIHVQNMTRPELSTTSPPEVPPVSSSGIASEVVDRPSG